jgi:hypothetical protein
MTVYFAFERETKGTWRYRETNDSGEFSDLGGGASIGILYIRKSALRSPPRAIVVTIQDQGQ